MDISMYIRAELARVAIDEGSRHGGINNMLGIAHVLRNRVMAGWGDWIFVVQHAFDKRGTIYPPDPIPDLRTNNVRVFLGRIDEIYHRTDLVDLTGGALFYYDSQTEPAPWFRDNILAHPVEHQRCAHIGPVWFYK